MADGLLNKASIILTPTGYKAGTLYNVAPVLEPYEDFDFARASVASRVNSSGLVEMVGRTLGSELVQNGDFSNGTNDWDVEGSATRVVGTYQGRSNVLKVNILNTSTASRIRQPFTYVNGATYKIIVNVYLESGSFRVDSSDSYVSGDFVSTTTTGSWQTITAYFTAISSGSNYIWLRSLTEVSEFYVDSISIKEIIDTNNIPRISYDSNGANGHILLEPTTTNLYLNTDTLSTQNVSTSASEYSVSFYGTGTITFSGSYSGSLVGTGVNNRVSLTFTATSGTLTSTVSGSVTNAQIENLGFSTSYMPSLSTQGVRATETATGAGSATLINSTEGVLYAEIAALADDLSTRYISITDGTSANVVYVRYDNVSNRIIGTITVGGSSPASFVTTSYTITDINKIALKWKTDDFALWINGTEVGSDSSGASFSANTLNELSFARNNTLNFYGKCKALAVFNEALSDAELNNLTG